MVGTIIFKHITGSEASKNWGVGFFYAAGFVFIMGLVNLAFLVEKPSDIGLNVEENGVLSSKTDQVEKEPLIETENKPQT